MRGKKILAKDLIGIQLCKEPKHDISDLMSEEYNREAKKLEVLYRELLPKPPKQKKKRKG